MGKKEKLYTVLVLRMANKKWKETKQEPSMLPGPAVPGCCLVSFNILWAILSTITVQSGVSYLSQGFKIMFWEDPPADWLILLATYCPGRPSQLT